MRVYSLLATRLVICFCSPPRAPIPASTLLTVVSVGMRCEHQGGLPCPVFPTVPPRIPPYYTLLVRSLSVLEGIALAADPNYKVRTVRQCTA